MNRSRDFLITLVILSLPAVVMAQSGDWGNPPPQPVRTSTCLVENTFSCAEYVYTYSVRGLSCTEDCLVTSNLNTCQLNNRCSWDPASGCFMKDVCTEISDLNTCRQWETHPICDS